MKYLIPPYIATIVLVLLYYTLYTIVDYIVHDSTNKSIRLLPKSVMCLSILGGILTVLNSILNAGLIYITRDAYSRQQLFNNGFGVILDVMTATIIILNCITLNKVLKDDTALFPKPPVGYKAFLFLININ